MLIFGEIFTEYRETITLAILLIFSVIWTNRVKNYSKSIANDLESIKHDLKKLKEGKSNDE